MDESLSRSFDFEDCENRVLVKLYASDQLELKDIDFEIDSDVLGVSTPTSEKWYFQLFGHIYPDKTEINTDKNNTQTSISITLYKQQPRVVWHTLHSLSSIPITPQRHSVHTGISSDRHYDTSSTETATTTVTNSTFLLNDHNSEQLDATTHFHELQFKKMESEISGETDATITTNFHIKKVEILSVRFTETNFIVNFQSCDEQFLQFHSSTTNFLNPQTKFKLLVRVKERIIPEQCTWKLTLTSIEIKLVKENLGRWQKLIASEYDEQTTKSQFPTFLSTQPFTMSTPPSLSSSTTTTVTPSKVSIALPAPALRASTTNEFKSLYSTGRDTSLRTTASAEGYTGIYNPANSCFMNAAIQCLANTRELRDYFQRCYYPLEINKTNPLGMKGAMVEEFGVLMDNLWSGKYNYTSANKLRNLVAQRHQEFVSNGQHDAQELLTILLDALHEDLNRVKIKPNVPAVEDQGRPDSVIADEYWQGYLSRNDSIIVQLFTGQFKSKTKCPQCNKESVTFDPFTSLSVPLPKRTAVDTIVTYRTEGKQPIKYRILMSYDGLIHELKSILSLKCGLHPTKMCAYRLRNNNRLVDYLKDDDRVSVNNFSWNTNDIIYITEALTSEECNNEKIVRLTFYPRVFKSNDFILPCAFCQMQLNPHIKPKCCTGCYAKFYCDDFHQLDCFDYVGQPFIVTLPKSKLTYENVVDEINFYSKYYLDITVQNGNGNFEQNNSDLEIDDDEEDVENFNDIENTDWPTLKSTLTSQDSWSICRIGDYLATQQQCQKKKRRHNYQTSNGKEKIQKKTNHNSGRMMIDEIDDDDEGYDILDDMLNKPLYRLSPQNTSLSIKPIVEADWYTDNSPDSPLKVLSSKHLDGVNNLIEDHSLQETVSGDQDITLQQCLSMFIEPEVLGVDDKWYCPHCKEFIQAIKQMSVWRLPPILIIHLKRFKYYHGTFGYMSDTRAKIDTNVKCPVRTQRDLNMAPYCSSTDMNDQNITRSRYDLFAMVNHRGTAWFGHYTAYARLLASNDSAKTEIGWRNFDDEQVSTLPENKDLVRSDAYVLFYRHRYQTVTYPQFLEQQQNSVVIDSTAPLQSHLSLNHNGKNHFFDDHASTQRTKDASMTDIDDLIK
ncbi:unnamed protein product [Didymodactylos carnosus]|uniref:ubiquitinyl hydrolase 1 n=1 Tax=Didymodactylos carnosus TaxID=1234261 RepID=A0A813QCJ1_9BILA|nr:unnamed protein product [Didymodactylos carnosus]CAF3546117.1 unnamed protein product [Didymodactylos carnosus]